MGSDKVSKFCAGEWWLCGDGCSGGFSCRDGGRVVKEAVQLFGCVMLVGLGIVLALAFVRSGVNMTSKAGADRVAD